MKDLLPNILIRTDCEARTFLSRLKILAKNSPKHCNYNYEKNSFLPDSDYLEIIPIEQNGHTEIFAQLFNKSEKNNIIQIEIRATWWKIEPVTYDIYSDEAKRIILPLILDYNKKYNSKRRLNIQTREAQKIKLPPKANEIFHTFVCAANKNILHPLDWKRFYIFIRHSYSNKVKINSGELKRLLIENGFDTEDADYLSNIYYHGKEILSVNN